MGAVETVGIGECDAAAERRVGIEQRLYHHHFGKGAEALNLIAITGSQLRAALEAIQFAPIRTDADTVVQSHRFAEFANGRLIAPRDCAGAALHARAAAMDRWCRLYDPEGQADVEAFFDAAARCPLVETADGIGFDPEDFADLIRFITEMPF